MLGKRTTLMLWIKYKKHLFIKRSNTEKRVKNTIRSGVLSTYFEVFDLVIKFCVKCLILVLKQNDFKRRNTE